MWAYWARNCGTIANEVNPGMSEAQPPAESGMSRRLEFLTTVVLAGAGLASAWASFQGGLWDRQEAEYYAVSNAGLTESSQLLIQSGQQAGVSAALFLQWLDATANNQPVRSEVIANHMPPWFAGEFARWRMTVPAELDKMVPNAPLPDFTSPTFARASKARAEADTARRRAEYAGSTGDAYDAANVVLATALFLAGIASILSDVGKRRAIVLLGGALTVAAIVAMAMTPMLMPG
jgi:hypothetical protein